jgi:IS5 family transposase
LLLSANNAKVERGEMLRIDSTVTDSPIHAPSDSTLLWDSVRVLVRLLQGAEAIAEGLVTIAYRNHQRVAKKRTRAIRYTRGKGKKAALYRDLITVTQNTLRSVEQASIRLSDPRIDPLGRRTVWQAQLDHYKLLIEKVIDQTERRVFQSEAVPAAQKIVSIFEEHTDIIVKGSREVQYGHKINLSTGRSGLILDVVIEQGNPADVDCCRCWIDTSTCMEKPRVRWRRTVATPVSRIYARPRHGTSTMWCSTKSVA